MAGRKNRGHEPAEQEHEEHDAYEGEEHGGNVDPLTIDRLLTMANVPELAAEGADLPILSWDNSVEVKGGDLTSLGFAKLVPGFAFRGYVVKVGAVDSQFDSAAGVKKQNAYFLRGTARVPVQGGNGSTFGEIRGNMKIPVYASLSESIEENRALEKKIGKPIAIEISYLGQNPDKKGANGEKLRSGRHLFKVARIDLVAN